MMIGQAEEIAVVENFIDALDVAQQDIRSLRVYEIQHVDAEEIRKKLEELGIVGASRSTSATSGRITSRAAAPGAPGQPRRAAAAISNCSRWFGRRTADRGNAGGGPRVNQFSDG